MPKKGNAQSDRVVEAVRRFEGDKSSSDPREKVSPEQTGEEVEPVQDGRDCQAASPANHRGSGGARRRCCWCCCGCCRFLLTLLLGFALGVSSCLATLLLADSDGGCASSAASAARVCAADGLGAASCLAAAKGARSGCTAAFRSADSACAAAVVQVADLVRDSGLRASDAAASEVERLRSERDQHAQETERLRAEAGSRAEEAQRLRSEAGEQAKEVERLRLEASQLGKERERLQSEAGDHAKETKRLQLEVEKLRVEAGERAGEVERLRLQVSDLSQSARPQGPGAAGAGVVAAAPAEGPEVARPIGKVEPAKPKVTPAQAALAVLESAALRACEGQDAAAAAACPHVHGAMHTWSYGINNLRAALQGEKHSMQGYLDQITGDLQAVLGLSGEDPQLRPLYRIAAQNNRAVFEAMRGFLLQRRPKEPLNSQDASLPLPARGLLCRDASCMAE